MKKDEPYRGFEQGRIRPPSESGSLLIRVSRNCPWNRCTFCNLYKDTEFSLRPAENSANLQKSAKFVDELVVTFQSTAWVFVVNASETMH